MKKLTVILTAALLLVGLGSCKKDPAATSLKLDPTSVTLKVGETQQLTATVKPDKAAVTYSSDKPEVATVDKNGLITAVAVGKATISATAGTLTRKCAVTVTDGKGGGVATQNELPLLKFDAKLDQQGNITDQAVLDHEKKLDRTPEVIDLGAVDGQDQKFPGFVNKNLTIPGVIYGLSIGRERVIIALSKESVADCPKTLEMLDKLGFKDIEDKQDKQGTPFKIGKKGDVTVELSDSPVADLGTTLRILFHVTGDLQIAHETISDVKDFPSWEAFETGDVNKIKEAEKKIGYREYVTKSDEAKKNLLFQVATRENLAKSNIYVVGYFTTPSKGDKMILAQLVCLKNEKDLQDAKLKEWFVANGYGNRFTVDTKNQMALGLDKEGKHVCAVLIGDESGMLVIREYKQQGQATVQIKRAVKQYEMMQTRTQLKGQVLQQVVIR